MSTLLQTAERHERYTKRTNQLHELSANERKTKTRHLIIEYSKKGLSAKLEDVRCYQTGLFY
jgi:hypothetical protein